MKIVGKEWVYVLFNPSSLEDIVAYCNKNNLKIHIYSDLLYYLGISDDAGSSVSDNADPLINSLKEHNLNESNLKVIVGNYNKI